MAEGARGVKKKEKEKLFCVWQEEEEEPPQPRSSNASRPVRDALPYPHDAQNAPSRDTHEVIIHQDFPSWRRSYTCGVIRNASGGEQGG